VHFTDAPDALSSLEMPVTVGHVFKTPNVTSSHQIIYQTLSKTLQLSGYGLIGSKKVDFYFNPPLVKSVSYDDISQYPLVQNMVQLRLRNGYMWSEEYGPLSVLGIDTGGGPVKVASANVPQGGVQVAIVRPDSEKPLDPDFPVLSCNASRLTVYADTPSFGIQGTHMDKIVDLKLFNDFEDNRFFINFKRSWYVTLLLNEDQVWVDAGSVLPSVLRVVSIDIGDGMVRVNPTGPDSGSCAVATVVQAPTVTNFSTSTIPMNYRDRLLLIGSGFPHLSSGFMTLLKFKPSLDEGIDYTLLRISDSVLQLTLLPGRHWRSTPGPLTLLDIMISRGAREIGVWRGVEDVTLAVTASEEADAVRIDYSGLRVYASALQQDIVVAGRGFESGMLISLDPPMAQYVDYLVTVRSDKEFVLQLRQGGAGAWPAKNGFLAVTKITQGGVEYPFSFSEGTIAQVLPNPTVAHSSQIIHESQSRVISILGTNFGAAADMVLTLSPTVSQGYSVIRCNSSTLCQVGLKRQFNWLPPFMSLNGDLGDGADRRLMLFVRSIDTGAGELLLPDSGVIVGYVVKDVAGVVCDDSCPLALDGVCGDGSGSNSLLHVCNPGTDCSDCLLDRAPLPPELPPATCDNTCVYARDGECDDPRGGNYCKLGTCCCFCFVFFFLLFFYY
jgi:hypothetical protein